MTASSAHREALTVLGILVAVLGRFVGASVGLLVIGIATLVATGLIGALRERRIRPRGADPLGSSSTAIPRRRRSPGSTASGFVDGRAAR